MTSKIVLGWPYSGALYAYIDGQINGDASARLHHDYYRTLYGVNFKKFVEHALMLVLIYDEVHLAPADAAWPESKLSDSRDLHPELGLSAPWTDGYQSLFADEHGHVQRYLRDAKIASLLPTGWAARQILSSIIYESALSVRLECELLCAPSRKTIIHRMLEIDRPSLHPTTASPQKIEIINNYMQASGLLLAPSGIDDLAMLKSSKNIRAYTSSFVDFLGRQESVTKASLEEAMYRRAREALETEEIASRVGGIFSWIGTFFRVGDMGPPGVGALVTPAGAALNEWELSKGRWVGLAPKVAKERSKHTLLLNINAKIIELEQRSTSSA